MRLGGDAAALADEELEAQGAGIDRGLAVVPADARQTAGSEPAGAAARDDVIRAGGLAVLAAGRDTSRRADDWIRGLAGRRGEPGESRFFLSAEDALLRGLESKLTRMIPRRLLERADGAPAGRLMTWLVDDVQRGWEKVYDERRTGNLTFEDVEAAQRGQVYAERRQVLTRADLRSHVGRMTHHVVDAYAEEYQDPERLLAALRRLYDTGLTLEDLGGRGASEGSGDAAAELRGRLRADARDAYHRGEELLGVEGMREFARTVILRVLDGRWRRHLLELDAIRDHAVRAAPDANEALLSYWREADRRYQVMRERVKRDVVGFVLGGEDVP